MNRLIVFPISTVGCQIRHLNLSVPLCRPEPMRRKRKIDPTLIRMREERKRLKLEKEIKKLQKHAKKLKPLDEMNLDFKIKHNIDAHIRPEASVNFEESERRAILMKDWCREKRKEYILDQHSIKAMIRDTEKALDVLRLTAPSVYEKSIQPDLSIFPLKFNGPVQTARMDKFISQDGDYIDVTRKFEGEGE